VDWFLGEEKFTVLLEAKEGGKELKESQEKNRAIFKEARAHNGCFLHLLSCLWGVEQRQEDRREVEGKGCTARREDPELLP
jgi:hypothetical protein